MSHKPKRLTLVSGPMRRGDTIEAWTFEIAAIPSPEDAIVTWSLHLESLSSPPVLALTSADGGPITTSVEDGLLLGTVPRVNPPVVGRLPWELQVRVPTVSVAAPAEGKWTRTIFDGVVVVEQDGADADLP